MLPLETILKKRFCFSSERRRSVFLKQFVSFCSFNLLYCLKKCIMLLLYPQIEVDTTRRHGQILYDDVTVRTPFSVVLTLLLCQGC